MSTRIRLICVNSFLLRFSMWNFQWYLALPPSSKTGYTYTVGNSAAFVNNVSFWNRFGSVQFVLNTHKKGPKFDIISSPRVVVMSNFCTATLKNLHSRYLNTLKHSSGFQSKHRQISEFRMILENFPIFTTFEVNVIQKLTKLYPWNFIRIK